MSETTYLINFDASATNLLSFNRYLTDSREIARFWNYIPLSYFVKTSLGVGELASRISTFVPVGNFIVAEVNPYNMQGRLPPAAWEWFYQPSSQITGLFGTVAPFPPPPPLPPITKK